MVAQHELEKIQKRDLVVGERCGRLERMHGVNNAVVGRKVMQLQQNIDSMARMLEAHIAHEDMQLVEIEK